LPKKKAAEPKLASIWDEWVNEDFHAIYDID
jgi:hypothetical protein